MRLSALQLQWHRMVCAVLVAAACTGVAASALANPPRNAEELGRALYTNCAACHGAEGQGGFAPPFKANANLGNVEYVIARILQGSPVMPSFREQFSPEELAALVNHLRNSWGNRAPKISASDVLTVEQRLARTVTPEESRP